MKKLLVVTSAVLLGLAAGCGLLSPPKPAGNEGGESGGAEASGGGGGGVDMREYMKVAEIFPLYDGIAAGHYSEQTTEVTAAGQKSTRRISCVGKKGEAWLIEIDDSAQQGLIQGLVVSAEGKVTKAYAGKADSDDVKQIEIAKAPAGGGVGVEPAEETVTVKAGTFKCLRTEIDIPGHGKTITWTGKEGDAAGIGVKSTSPGGSWELASLEKKPKEIGPVTFECRVAVLSNKFETWYADEPAHFAGEKVVVKTDQTVTEVTAVGADAKPRLRWPQ